MLHAMHRKRSIPPRPVRFAWCIAGMSGLALLAGPAAAIVAKPGPRICTSYSAADAVVVGRVVSQRSTGEWNSWRVEVEQGYKGATGARLTMYSRNASARATPDLGQRNILFLYREGGKWLAWGSDPNTGGPALPRIERAVQALANARPAATGSVVGLVASEQGAEKAGWTVQLARAGSKAVRTATTDRTGRFAIDLPPGTWHARIVRPGWTSRFSLYSYDRADRFTVKAGGCNDLRLEPVQL